MIKIGQEYRQIFSYTQSDVDSFSRITGDDNPIHHSESYSKNTVFRKPIIHGFLSASVFSKILGMHLPGEGTIYLSQSLKFLRPMYVGIAYEGVVEVVDLNTEKGICTLLTKVLDEKGKVMIEGEAMALNKSAMSG